MSRAEIMKELIIRLLEDQENVVITVIEEKTQKEKTA